MQTPARADPPYVPLRHSGWPTRRTPRWWFAAGLLVLVAAVLVGIAVHPSRSQRATDIKSCAGGVAESLTVLRAIEGGTSHDLNTAVHVATYGAGNCSPANNMQLDDLVGYQVHESLASFRLDRAVNGLLTWAFPDAQRVQSDVATVLRAHGAARAAATASLRHDLRVLDGQRAYVNKIMMAAITATAASGRPLPLPG